MECKITLKLDGQKIETFDSDERLDVYLARKASALEGMLFDKKHKEWDKIFALTEEEQATLDKVKEITDTFGRAPKETVVDTGRYNPDLEENEVPMREHVKGAISVTTAVETIGNDRDIYKPIVTATNKEYENKFKETENDRLLKNGVTDAVERQKLVNEAWTKQQWKGRISADLGDDIHYIMETLFKQREDPSLEVDPKNFKRLPESVYLKYRHMFKAKVDEIVSLYGKDAKYLTEVPIISKHLPDAVITALQARNLGNISAIDGRIDLLVIDASGKAHIYDWKTSNKLVGPSWGEMNNKELAKHGYWPSAKKVKAFGQQGFYGAILEQYGIEVADMQLVPLFADYTISDDGKSIEEIKSLVWDVTHKNGDPDDLVTVHTMRKMRTAEYMFGVTKPISIESLKDVGDILNKIFPGTNLGNELTKHEEATAEWFLDPNRHFIKAVSQDSEEYKKGNRYYFYPAGLPERGKRVYGKSLEEIKEKVRKYVSDLNTFRGNQMWNFNKDLQNVLYTRGENKQIMGDWLSSFAQTGQKPFLENQFKKYIRNGWILTANEELANQGIFLFKKGQQIDIVCISHKDLHYIMPIIHEYGEKTHNVLGHKLRDTDVGADPISINMNGNLTGTLLSNYGNLIHMQIAAILASNPEIMTGAKINSIKVINPWHQTEDEVQSNEQFYENWNRLVQLHPELNLRTLGPIQFFKDEDVCLNNAAELLMSQSIDFSSGLLSAVTEEKTFDEESLRNMLSRLRQKYSNTYQNQKTPEGYAYLQIQKALLHIRGIHVYYEPDRGKYLNQGLFPTGTFMYPADISMSTNGRVLGYMMSGFSMLHTDLFNAEANPFNKLCEEVYKEWGATEQLTNPRIFWKRFFEEDEKGNVSKEMRLKRPDHPDFADKPKSREFIKYFTSNLAKYRYKGLSLEELAEVKETDDYYNVPLLPAQLGQYIRDSFQRGGIKGVLTSFWQKLKDMGQEAYAYYSGEIEWQKKWEQAHSDEDVVYNKFLDINPAQRNELIYGKEGKASNRVFDTDLRSIFLHAMVGSTLSQASETWGPLFAAVVASINYLHEIGGANMKEILEFVKAFVDNKVFLRDIRDPSMKGLKNMMNTIKKISSAFTLGFSTRNFSKEMITQLYISATRSATKQIPDITPDDFWFAFKMAIQHAPTSVQIQNFMMFLNQRYGMSSYSGNEMAETIRRSRFGLRNMNTGDIFIGTKIPDDYYRLSILIAKMHHDGCLSAYVEDGDTWRYDITKDTRFDRYLANDLSDPNKYAEQKALFERFRIEWERQKQGQPEIYADWDFSQASDEEYRKRATSKNGIFPDAYPPSIKGAVQTEANNLYGAFDQKSKSLLTATFLGSLFMQYKTWLAAKINQWMRAPGFVNVWQRHWQTDANGKKLYVIYANDEELNKGIDPIRYINEDDPHLAEWLSSGRCAPYIIEEGTFQEGMVQATGAFLKDIITWDMAEFKRHWEDPILRGQLINGLFDTLGMLLFAGLIQLMFGEEVVKNKKAQPWLTQWSYGVLMGFAQDGPLHQVLGSTISDLNPPSVLALKQWAQTAHSVLSGSKSIGLGITSSLGALREFTGYWYTQV